MKWRSGIRGEASVIRAERDMVALRLLDYCSRKFTRLGYNGSSNGKFAYLFVCSGQMSI